MRFIARSAGLFLGVGLVFAGPSHAQDLSLFGQMPPTFEKCERERQERQLAIRAVRERIQQCLSGNPSGRFVSIPVCNYPGSITCADLEQQACVLSDANIERSRLCSDRAGEFQRQEAERERLEANRLRAEEANARDEDRALRMLARAAGRGDLALAASIARGGVVDPNDPTRAPRVTASVGRHLANAMGVSTTPAMRLSGEFSSIALDSYRDLGARALGELNSAMGSGAFDVDGSSDTPSGPTLRFSTVSNSDTTAALQSEAQAYADLWNTGGDIGRVIAVAAIAARIAAITQDRPNSNAEMARVSLVSGAFARSINSLTEAASRGEISLTDGTSPYAMVSRVVALPTEKSVSEVILEPSSQTDDDANRCLKTVSRPNSIGPTFDLYQNICDKRIWCDRTLTNLEVDRSFLDPDQLYFFSNQRNCTFEGQVSQNNKTAIRCVLKETAFDAGNQPYSMFKNTCDEKDIICSGSDRTGSWTVIIRRGLGLNLLIEAEITSCDVHY